MTCWRLPVWAAVAVGSVAAASNAHGQSRQTLLARRQEQPAAPALELSLSPPVQAELLQRVASEQNRLFELLESSGRDLNKTQERINYDLEAARKGLTGLMDLKNRTIMANGTAMTNKELTTRLNGSFDGVDEEAVKTSENISALNMSMEQTHINLGGLAKIISAGKRSADGAQAFNLMKPRLIAVGKQLEKMESRVHFGNLSAVVHDEVNEQVLNVVEDVGRGLASNLPDPSMPKKSPSPGPAPGPGPALSLMSRKRDIDDTDGTDEEEETVTVEDDLGGESGEQEDEEAEGEEDGEYSAEEQANEDVQEDPEANNGNYDELGRSLEEQAADNGDYANPAESDASTNPPEGDGEDAAFAIR